MSKYWSTFLQWLSCQNRILTSWTIHAVPQLFQAWVVFNQKGHHRISFLIREIFYTKLFQNVGVVQAIPQLIMRWTQPCSPDITLFWPSLDKWWPILGQILDTASKFSEPPTAHMWMCIDHINSAHNIVFIIITH